MLAGTIVLTFCFRPDTLHEVCASNFDIVGGVTRAARHPNSISERPVAAVVVRKVSAYYIGSLAPTN